MTEIERTELARERTHAAWLRTSLAFLVALAAVFHYTDEVNTGRFILVLIFTFGAAVSACRAVSNAPHPAAKMLPYLLVFAPAAVVLAF